VTEAELAGLEVLGLPRLLAPVEAVGPPWELPHSKSARLSIVEQQHLGHVLGQSPQGAEPGYVLGLAQASETEESAIPRKLEIHWLAREPLADPNHSQAHVGESERQAGPIVAEGIQVGAPAWAVSHIRLHSASAQPRAEPEPGLDVLRRAHIRSQQGLEPGHTEALRWDGPGVVHAGAVELAGRLMHYLWVVVLVVGVER
jgi:hypothetical protein